MSKRKKPKPKMRTIQVTEEQYRMLYPDAEDSNSNKEDEEMAKTKMPLWAKILIGIGGAAAVGGATYGAVSYLGSKDELSAFDDFEDEDDDDADDDSDAETEDK